MQRYDIKESLGSGNFGTVFRATNKVDGHEVAIKHMKVDYTSWKECANCRELRALQMLAHHPCIVQLFEVIREPDDSFCLVFEYMGGGSLLDYIKECRKQITRPPHSHQWPHSLMNFKIKRICEQIFRGLAFMHERGIVHRDIKPENLLMDGDICKVGDLGLARDICRPPLTDYISTRWYRAPEILLRLPGYHWPVDVFALGCVMAEMYNLRPLFPGESEIDQLHRILTVLGIDALRRWPDGTKAATRMNFSFASQYEQGGRPVPMRTIMPSAPDAAVSLIGELLHLDPDMRLSAADALQHDYFLECDGTRSSMTPLTTSATRPPPQPVSVSPGHKDAAASLRRMFLVQN